jgi:hypothetical protein
MTLEEMYSLVQRGRWERRGRYYWVCGKCRTSLDLGVNAGERDRLAVLHCWAHASSEPPTPTRRQPLATAVASFAAARSLAAAAVAVAD